MKSIILAFKMDEENEWKWNKEQKTTMRHLINETESSSIGLGFWRRSSFLMSKFNSSTSLNFLNYQESNIEELFSNKHEWIPRPFSEPNNANNM